MDLGINDEANLFPDIAYIYLYVYLAAGFLEPVKAAVGEIFGESCVRLSLFRQLKHSFMSTYATVR
jgi:hypothetical protein